MLASPRFRRLLQPNGSHGCGLRVEASHAAMSRARAAGAGILGAAALLLLFAVACGDEADSTAQGTITPQQVAAMIEAGDASLILDVRTPAEFESGHIPGAINIPHTELPARKEELAAYRDQEVVVLCESGGRARSARAVLAAAGFERVLDLTGHMSAWRDGGFPLE